MSGEIVVLLLGGTSIPFVAYGVAGVWNHWKSSRPVDPKAVLAERFAKGEIDEDEYMRRLSVLTYGPPLPLLPTVMDIERPAVTDDPSH